MNVKNNSIILLIFSTILFFSCEKENKDIFSETKWQLIGNSLESINDDINIEEYIDVVGCGECENVGYNGRTAMYEILEVDDNIKHEIKFWTDSSRIKEIAIESGMITFKESAKYLIENNITTIEECGILEGI